MSNPKTHLFRGAIKKDDVTWYRCSDCGMRHEPLKNNTMRPNNKFCDISCMIFVLENGFMSGARPKGWRKWVDDQKNTPQG